MSDTPRITELASLLADAIAWQDYADHDRCPRCEGESFKMSCPPICTTCGWKSPRHPQTLYFDLIDALHAEVTR